MGIGSCRVVGSIPAGLPTLHLPTFKFEWMREMSGSAVAIALLGLLEALAVAKSLALQTREKLDYNRQCLAEGLANLGGGFFQCMPGSGSLTRSTINFNAGAATRWSGVFSAAATALIVLLFAPLASYMPTAALAGILLVTAAGLVDWPRLRFARAHVAVRRDSRAGDGLDRGVLERRIFDPRRHDAVVHHVRAPRGPAQGDRIDRRRRPGRPRSPAERRAMHARWCCSIWKENCSSAHRRNLKRRFDNLRRRTEPGSAMAARK